MVEVIVKDLVVNFPKFVCQDRASDISCRYRHQEELQNELAVITAWDLAFYQLGTGGPSLASASKLFLVSTHVWHPCLIYV